MGLSPFSTVLPPTFDCERKIAIFIPIALFIPVMVDADWVGDTGNSRSHTSFVLMFNGGPISWETRIQVVIDYKVGGIRAYWAGEA
jgi:hypothetical protein